MHQALIALTAVAITATALSAPLAHASPSQPAPPKVAIVISPLPSQVEMEATLRRASQAQAHEAEQFAKVMAGQALDDSLIHVSGRYTARCPHGVVQGRLDSRYPQMKDPCGRPFPWAP